MPDSENMKHAKRIFFLLVIPLVLVSGFAAFYANARGGKSVPVITTPNLKVALVANTTFNWADPETYNYTDGTEILTLIKNEEADMVIHSGDLDMYRPQQVAGGMEWDEHVTFILGENFPYFISGGNFDTLYYDKQQWPDYQQWFQARIDRIPEANCTGDLGEISSCSYKGLFFTLTSHGMPANGNISNNHYDGFIENALKQDKSVWSICSFHHAAAQQQANNLGQFSDTATIAAAEECRKGGGIIVNGGDSLYLRSHLMRNFPRHQIVNANNHLEIREGNTFYLNSGLGGSYVGAKSGDNYETMIQNVERDEFAIVYSALEDESGVNYFSPSPGALFCTFHVNGDPRQAECYFKTIDGEIIDTFTIESKVKR